MGEKRGSILILLACFVGVNLHALSAESTYLDSYLSFFGVLLIHLVLMVGFVGVLMVFRSSFRRLKLEDAVSLFCCSLMFGLCLVRFISPLPHFIPPDTLQSAEWIKSIATNALSGNEDAFFKCLGWISKMSGLEAHRCYQLWMFFCFLGMILSISSLFNKFGPYLFACICIFCFFGFPDFVPVNLPLYDRLLALSDPKVSFQMFSFLLATALIENFQIYLLLVILLMAISPLTRWVCIVSLPSIICSLKIKKPVFVLILCKSLIVLPIIVLKHQSVTDSRLLFTISSTFVLSMFNLDDLASVLIAFALKDTSLFNGLNQPILHCLIIYSIIASISRISTALRNQTLKGIFDGIVLFAVISCCFTGLTQTLKSPKRIEFLPNDAIEIGVDLRRMFENRSVLFSGLTTGNPVNHVAGLDDALTQNGFITNDSRKKVLFDKEALYGVAKSVDAIILEDTTTTPRRLQNTPGFELLREKGRYKVYRLSDMKHKR